LLHAELATVSSQLTNWVVNASVKVIQESAEKLSVIESIGTGQSD